MAIEARLDIQDDEDEQLLLDRPLNHRFYPTVFLDVDSCLCGLEGIDLLAKLHGKEREVAALTKLAMDGEVPLDQVFIRRLELIAPQTKDMKVVADEYQRSIVPDAKEVITVLTKMGVTVRLLSGGYEQAILPLAGYLGVDEDKVYANKLIFDHRGKYQGFDGINPLTRPGGKRKIIENLLRKKEVVGNVAIVGDAVSELETRPITDLFIGYGCWVTREMAMFEADVFLTEIAFAPLLPLLLDRAGAYEIINYNPSFRKILQKGFLGLKKARFHPRSNNIQRDLSSIYDRIPKNAFLDKYQA